MSDSTLQEKPERAGRPRRARSMVAMAVTALGLAGGLTLAAGGVASASESLPAYTANGFCSTSKGYNNFQEAVCTGEYKVNKSNYIFTQNALGYCPVNGIMVELDEIWVSGPNGGSPNILAWYSVSAR